jgi:hypothetical protein
MNHRLVTALVTVLAAASPAHADRQSVAPGTGRQASIVADAGPNGICETPARPDDLQEIPVGQGAPHEDAVRCGPNQVAESFAGGDDVQRIAPGDNCGGPNAIVVDTGPDGVTASTAGGDDVQLLLPGTGLENAGCMIAGADGLASTPDPLVGDDRRQIPFGTAEPNTAVIRCGLNQVAETFANNVRAGDDVQRVGVGNPCENPQGIVVDSGANGIAETRAQGAELVLALARPLAVTIGPKKPVGTRRFRVAVQNLEYGSTAPSARTYRLVARDGSCPDGTVTEVDADSRARGVQETAIVPLRRRVKGSVVVTLRLQDITSVARNIPFRCSIEVEAEATDVAPDDASNPANNRADVPIEVVDRTDL